ncbi:hypothetical protein [Streptomyces sp. NPDC054849]
MASGEPAGAAESDPPALATVRHETGLQHAEQGVVLPPRPTPATPPANLHAGASTLEGPTLDSRVAAFGNAFIAQPTSSGALPTLYAATAPGVRPDAFIGPRFGWRGRPVRSWRAKWTLDEAAGELLWAASEKLTGLSYASLPR